MKYLIIFFILFFTSCGQECDNFIIKKVYLQPVKLIGADTLQSIERIYAMLSFELEYVNCKRVFMGGGAEPGVDGIENQVTKIIILDSNHVDVADKFIGMHFKGDVIRELNDSMTEISFCANTNLQELKNNINLHKRTESGIRLEFPRLFTMPDSLTWPLLFEIYFKNSDSLVQKINKSEIKTYLIK